MKRGVNYIPRPGSLWRVTRRHAALSLWNSPGAVGEDNAGIMDVGETVVVVGVESKRGFLGLIDVAVLARGRLHWLSAAAWTAFKHTGMLLDEVTL